MRSILNAVAELCRTQQPHYNNGESINKIRDQLFSITSDCYLLFYETMIPYAKDLERLVECKADSEEDRRFKLDSLVSAILEVDSVNAFLRQPIGKHHKRIVALSRLQNHALFQRIKRVNHGRPENQLKICARTIKFIAAIKKEMLAITQKIDILEQRFNMLQTQDDSANEDFTFAHLEIEVLREFDDKLIETIGMRVYFARFFVHYEPTAYAHLADLDFALLKHKMRDADKMIIRLYQDRAEMLIEYIQDMTMKASMALLSPNIVRHLHRTLLKLCENSCLSGNKSHIPLYGQICKFIGESIVALDVVDPEIENMTSELLQLLAMLIGAHQFIRKHKNSFTGRVIGTDDEQYALAREYSSELTNLYHDVSAKALPPMLAVPKLTTLSKNYFDKLTSNDYKLIMYRLFGITTGEDFSIVFAEKFQFTELSTV